VLTSPPSPRRPVNFGEFRAFFLLLPQNDMIMDYFMSTKDSSPCDIGGCVVLHEKTGERAGTGVACCAVTPFARLALIDNQLQTEH
jgi:hypothetical protein